MRLGTRLLDPAALLAVLAMAALARLAFLSVDPPAFLTTDSLTYALPAVHLANGQGFDLSLRRTPGYPLFLAAIWAAFGDDPRPVVYLQHAFGAATAGLAWLLGRLAVGRLPAVLAGLAVALSGPQIVYEHYLMTESLFTLLLVLGMISLVLALRRDSAGLYVLTGALFGLCAWTRPVGQILPLLVPVAAVLAGRRDGGTEGRRDGGIRGLPLSLRPSVPPSLSPSLRRAIRAVALALLGFALVLAPWLGRNYLVGGEATGSSAIGKTLFGRITRHDDGFRFDLPPAGPAEPDPRRREARDLARREAQRDTSRGSLVHEQLMREFGYTEAQAYNVMRDVALEVILAQPAYFLQSSLLGVGQLLLAEPEPFRSHVDRLANDRLRRDWLQRPELAPLLPATVPPEVRWRRLERANHVAQLFRPWDGPLGPPVAVLALVGAVAILLRPAWRAALPIPLAVVAVLVLSAFLDGPVPRFRYPLDPFIVLAAGAGLVASAELIRRGLRSRAHSPMSEAQSPMPKGEHPRPGTSEARPEAGEGPVTAGAAGR